MSNITRAHSFNAWFLGNSADRISAALSRMETCERLFDRYADDIWNLVAERAVAAGQDISEWLAEYFGFDMIDSLKFLKTCMVRFACERLAFDLIQPAVAA